MVSYYVSSLYHEAVGTSDKPCWWWYGSSKEQNKIGKMILVQKKKKKEGVDAIG